ncbi:MAG TPA: FCD domain-containing protein [Microbacteriaceae bacterium]|jgi:Transcriptional regulators
MDDPIDVESFSLFEPFLGPVHVPAAYEHVVERLRRSIWLRLLLPGERLPPERALAESLGVSRVTVREALRVLQGEGLVATSRGSGGGTVVQEPQATPEQRRLHLSRSRLQLGHLHELRLAVEPAAASLAAVRATDPDIARLERTQAALSESTGLNTFRQADSAFHIGVAAASKNSYLARVIEDARANLFIVLDVADFEVHRETSGRAHADILAAITARDSARAAVLMEQHLREAWLEIMTAYEGFNAQIEA